MDNAAAAFDWTQLRAFLATVDHGSLSAAARILKLTQPTVGRQIAALEADLGVLLFERVGRTMQPTATGLDLVEHVRSMEEAATRVALVASGRSQAVDGLVRITASDVFAAYLLPKVLHDIRAAAPLLHIDLVAANDVQDLLRREADIAIRHLRPEQPDLIARKLGDAQAYFYTSENYLAGRAVPQKLEDLHQHDFVSFGDPDRMIGYMKPLGLSLNREQFRYGSASGLVSWELVRAGFGVAPMSQRVGSATPGVVRLLPDMNPIVFPVWLVTHRELHSARRIRVVFDIIAEALNSF
jgi:DNA-binding transcriptional LysR family regulator